jgi:hypothetical protein
MDAELLAARYSSLQRQLARIGYICNGTVMRLYRKCGKPGCGCKEDPQMRHGPYYIWTRKENGKTVTRSLSKEHAERCVEYISNSRRMESILEEMKKISTGIVEAGR